ncbi:hypothetical protein CLU79DRAFT_720929 [Phycomyces nitens]|nr:hypothetical protein CLU79DRAFT_720929 [Phycomyces nitens]
MKNSRRALQDREEQQPEQKQEQEQTQEQLFKIVTKFIDNGSLCFQIGEYKLESVKHEIDRRADEKSKACSYNADGCHTGVVGGKTVELSLLEVTGAFGFSEISRSTKDHIKGSFGTLALLQ